MGFPVATIVVSTGWVGCGVSGEDASGWVVWEKAVSVANMESVRHVCRYLFIVLILGFVYRWRIVSRLHLIQAQEPVKNGHQE